MNIDNDIYLILAEAGPQGLSASKIARHVTNARSSLFSPLPYDEVYLKVRKTLTQAVQHTNSPIERAQRRGRYRLNTASVRGRQLMLQFQAHCQQDVLARHDDTDNKQDNGNKQDTGNKQEDTDRPTDASLSLF